MHVCAWEPMSHARVCMETHATCMCVHAHACTWHVYIYKELF